MSFTFVQAREHESNSTTNAAAYSSNVSAGDLLVVFTDWNGAAALFTSIADTQANTWTQVGPFVTSTSVGTFTLGCFYAIAKSSGANTVTLTITSAVLSGLILLEYSGNSGSPFDTSTSTINGFNGTINLSLTPVAAGELLILCSGNNSPGQNYTVGSGFTARTNQSNVLLGAGDLLSSAAGSNTGSLQWAINTGDEGIMVAFKQRAGGVPNSLMLMGCGT
jgi:hypothetical protein